LTESDTPGADQTVTDIPLVEVPPKPQPVPPADKAAEEARQEASKKRRMARRRAAGWPAR